MKMLPEKILMSLQPITLAEMGKVKLMNRVDSKYVTTVEKVVALLATLGEDFFIQEIDGKRNMPYHTCYYDTEESDMFYQHQRGKKARQKIRTRVYEDTDTLPFLEIKNKNNKGRTKKKRVSMEESVEVTDYSDFLTENSAYTPEDLSSKIENHFYRITLVNKDLTERITIDTALEFHNLTNGNKVSLPEISIIEWKRDGLSGKSGLLLKLRALRILESGFSKYCIGMALTDTDLKQNRLKPRLRFINKLKEVGS